MSISNDNLHAVRFYESPESLCRIVAEFLGEGLVSGQPALIIATPEHRAGIVAELDARRFDVGRLQAAGDVLFLDAADTLDQVLVNGMPDANSFSEVAISAIERLCRGRTDCTIRAYGEMVDVLWRADRTAAAIRLEMLWNSLAQTHVFSLLCGYSMGSFYKDASIKEICEQHTHVATTAGRLERAKDATIALD
jgi:DcmR-like sensory protein